MQQKYFGEKKMFFVLKYFRLKVQLAVAFLIFYEAVRLAFYIIYNSNYRFHGFLFMQSGAL